MLNKQIETEEEIKKIVQNAEESEGKDADEIRKMYLTPDEALGRIVRISLHFGFSMGEIVDVDVDNDTYTTRELFTGTKTEFALHQSLDFPQPGTEFTVKAIEGKRNGEWEQITALQPSYDWRGPSIRKSNYENCSDFRAVEQTYTYGETALEKHNIRIDDGEPATTLESEVVEGERLLETILSSIQTPEDFSLDNLYVGEIFTREIIEENENGQPEKTGEEIIWWNIDHQFQKSRTRVSPVTELDHDFPTIIYNERTPDGVDFDYAHF